MNETPSNKTGTAKKSANYEGSLSSGGNFASLNGWNIPNDYGSTLDEYLSFKEKTVITDFSDSGVVSLQGKDAADFLHKMTTNNMLNINTNEPIVTVLTDADGHFVDVITVLSRNDRFLLIGSEGNGQTIFEWLDKYHFSEEITIVDESGKYGLFALYGKTFPEILSSQEYLLIGSDDESAFILVENNVPSVWAKLVESGLTPAGREAWNLIRTERGIPRFGFEIIGSANPLEAGFTHAVSFTKGCYIGQEVIARMDTYDKVSRELRRLHFSKKVDKSGHKLLTKDGKPAGEITTSVYSPELGKQIGLGYVKKKYIELGSELSVSGTDLTAVIGEGFLEESKI